MKVGWNLDQGPPFCKISILLHNYWILVVSKSFWMSENKISWEFSLGTSLSCLLLWKKALLFKSRDFYLPNLKKKQYNVIFMSFLVCIFCFLDNIHQIKIGYNMWQNATNIFPKELSKHKSNPKKVQILCSQHFTTSRSEFSLTHLGLPHQNE